MTRRTTRSYSTTTPNSHNLAEPTKPSNLEPMKLEDLTFGDEPISFEDLISSFPGYIEPIPVYFSDYTEDDLRQIFMRNQANSKLYSSFLDVVLRPLCRITRRVDELSAAFSPLFKKYCEPLSDMGVVASEEIKRRLFSHLQPHIMPSLNEVFRVSSQPSSEGKSQQGKGQTQGQCAQIWGFSTL